MSDIQVLLFYLLKLLFTTENSDTKIGFRYQNQFLFRKLN